MVSKEIAEGLYIKRLTFYLLLATQTAVGLTFLLSDHYEVRAIKEKAAYIEQSLDRLREVERVVQDYKSFKEGTTEFKSWATKAIDASIVGRTNLRMELSKSNELRYALQQCTTDIQEIKKKLEKHEAESRGIYKSTPQSYRDN